MKQRFLACLAIAALGACAWWGLGDTGTSGDDATREPQNQRQGTRHFVENVDMSGMLRGNIHVHTRISDGDSGPEQVIRWYAEQGYDFLSVTDHNRRVVHAPRDLPDGFVLVPGEEVTMAATGKPVHVNGICTNETIGEARFSRRDDALRWAVARIEEQGGIAMINHPNFLWALGEEHIAAASRAHLLDIYNGHPQVKSDGDDAHAPVEALWQALLDRGVLLAPAAVDDAHAFTHEPPSGVPNARPGTGWIEVAAAERSAEAICEALRRGRVVASHGPRITRVRVQDRDLGVWVREPGEGAFIGRGGEELSRVDAEPDGDVYVARYALRGDESFVRARVTASDGSRAWTPAFHTIAP